MARLRTAKSAALEAYKAKIARLAREAAASDKPSDTTVRAEIYWCLFGVYESPDGKPPTTRGIWADELAITTYTLYLDAYRARIRFDSICGLDPEKVTRADLEACRSRMLRTATEYKRKRREEWTDDHGRRRVRETIETVKRPLPNPRSVERYLTPIILVLRRCGNDCVDDLAPLKKPPVKKAWLSRKDKDAFMALLKDPTIRLAAEMMVHGMCIGEVCQVSADAFDGNCIRVEEQMSQIRGKGKVRKELKRERRYRSVPVSNALKEMLRGREGRLVPLLPNNLRRDIRLYLKGSRFVHLTPHDLRRSGGKWMLDAGAKLNDVAAILGNDPKTLLTWYDVADREGMARAVQVV